MGDIKLVMISILEIKSLIKKRDSGRFRDNGRWAMKVTLYGINEHSSGLCYQRPLGNSDWMPASYNRRQSSHPHLHPTCWVSLQKSNSTNSTDCHGAWSSVPISTHLSVEWECHASQIGTPIFSSRATTHRLIWPPQLKCGSGQISDKMWNGCRALRLYLVSFRHRHAGQRVNTFSWMWSVQRGNRTNQMIIMTKSKWPYPSTIQCFTAFQIAWNIYDYYTASFVANPWFDSQDTCERLTP